LPNYVSNFCIASDGKVVSKTDESLDVRTVIAAMQKERIHWTMPTTVAGYEPMRSISDDTPANHAAIVEQQAKKWFDKH